MSENFPNLKETDIKLQKAQRAPKKLNPNKTTARYVVVKKAKIKIKKDSKGNKRKTKH